MEELGKSLAQQSFILRTGNCQGADQAFQKGANAINPKLVELFLPWPGYERESIAVGNVAYLPSRRAYALAARYHPVWQNCSLAMKALHARNAQIILGPELTDPVEFVICWTPRGKAVGGTATGIRIAQDYGITVRNLALESRKHLAYTQPEFCW